MNDPYLTYSDYISEKMSTTKVRDLNDIIEFVTADDPELSELSDDENFDQHDEVEPIAESDQSTYEDESTVVDNIPLSAISAAKSMFIDGEKGMYCSVVELLQGLLMMCQKSCSHL